MSSQFDATTSTLSTSTIAKETFKVPYLNPATRKVVSNAPFSSSKSHNMDTSSRQTTVKDTAHKPSFSNPSSKRSADTSNDHSNNIDNELYFHDDHPSQNSFKSGESSPRATRKRPTLKLVPQQASNAAAKQPLQQQPNHHVYYRKRISVAPLYSPVNYANGNSNNSNNDVSKSSSNISLSSQNSNDSAIASGIRQTVLAEFDNDIKDLYNSNLSDLSLSFIDSQPYYTSSQNDTASTVEGSPTRTRKNSTNSHYALNSYSSASSSRKNSVSTPISPTNPTGNAITTPRYEQNIATLQTPYTFTSSSSMSHRTSSASSSFSVGSPSSTTNSPAKSYKRRPKALNLEDSNILSFVDAPSQESSSRRTTESSIHSDQSFHSIPETNQNSVETESKTPSSTTISPPNSSYSHSPSSSVDYHLTNQYQSPATSFMSPPATSTNSMFIDHHGIATSGIDDYAFNQPSVNSVKIDRHSNQSTGHNQKIQHNIVSIGTATDVPPLTPATAVPANTPGLEDNNQKVNEPGDQNPYLSDSTANGDTDSDQFHEALSASSNQSSPNSKPNSDKPTHQSSKSLSGNISNPHLLVDPLQKLHLGNIKPRSSSVPFKASQYEKMIEKEESSIFNNILEPQISSATTCSINSSNSVISSSESVASTSERSHKKKRKQSATSRFFHRKTGSSSKSFAWLRDEKSHHDGNHDNTPFSSTHSNTQNEDDNNYPTKLNSTSNFSQPTFSSSLKRSSSSTILPEAAPMALSNTVTESSTTRTSLSHKSSNLSSKIRSSTASRLSSVVSFTSSFSDKDKDSKESKEEEHSHHHNIRSHFKHRHTSSNASSTAGTLVPVQTDSSNDSTKPTANISPKHISSKHTPLFPSSSGVNLSHHSTSNKSMENTTSFSSNNNNHEASMASIANRPKAARLFISIPQSATRPNLDKLLLHSQKTDNLDTESKVSTNTNNTQRENWVGEETDDYDNTTVPLWFLKQVVLSHSKEVGLFLTTHLFLPKNMWSVLDVEPRLLSTRIECLKETTKIGQEFLDRFSLITEKTDLKTLDSGLWKITQSDIEKQKIQLATLEQEFHIAFIEPLSVSIQHSGISDLHSFSATSGPTALSSVSAEELGSKISPTATNESSSSHFSHGSNSSSSHSLLALATSLINNKDGKESSSGFFSRKSRLSITRDHHHNLHNSDGSTGHSTPTMITNSSMSITKKQAHINNNNSLKPISSASSSNMSSFVSSNAHSADYQHQRSSTETLENYLGSLSSLITILEILTKYSNDSKETPNYKPIPIVPAKTDSSTTTTTTTIKTDSEVSNSLLIFKSTVLNLLNDKEGVDENNAKRLCQDMESIEIWTNLFRRFVSKVICRLVLKDVLSLVDLYQNQIRDWILS